MPEFISAILAKALVMALEALLTHLFIQMVRLMRYRLAPTVVSVA
jgi:hypothetical protein